MQTKKDVPYMLQVVFGVFPVPKVCKTIQHQTTMEWGFEAGECNG